MSYSRWLLCWVLEPAQVGTEQVHTEVGCTELNDRGESASPKACGGRCLAAVMTCVAAPTPPRAGEGRARDTGALRPSEASSFFLKVPTKFGRAVCRPVPTRMALLTTGRQEAQGPV